MNTQAPNHQSLITNHQSPNHLLTCLPRRSPWAKPDPLPQPKPGSLEVSTHQVQFVFDHPDPVQPFWLALYLCRESSTLVARTLQIDYVLCKTNPISTEAKTNLTLYTKKVYEDFIPPRTMKNEPKTNPKRTQFPLPQSRYPSQLAAAEIKALLRDYRIRLFYLICMQRIEYGARNDCGQSLFESQGLCGKTIRVVYFNRLICCRSKWRWLS